MMRFARGFAVVLLLVLSPAAFAQRRGASPAPPKSAPSSVTSTSRLVITGGGLQGEAFTLPKFHGDWFVNASDAHALLNLSSVPPSHPISIQLQWDGKQSTTVIGHDIDTPGSRVSFFLQISGQPPYDLAARPDDTNTITVTVIKMDGHDLEARLNGTITRLGETPRSPGYKPIQIFGNIVLHRDSAPAPLVTGSYLNCDPVIHDKLVGAEARSPGECEVKFDAAVRQTLHQAFRPVMNSLTAANWLLENQPALGPITSIARHTETSPYRLDSAHEGAYRFTLHLNPASEQYQRYRTQMEQAMQRAAAAMAKGGPGPGAPVNQLGRAAQEMQAATAIAVSALINQPSSGFLNFQGEHTVLQVPGASWAVSAPHVQAPTGGGLDGSQEVTYVYLGAWGAPTVQKQSDGAERVSISASFDQAAPLLAVQNMTIRIQANAALRQSILQQIDWPALRNLLSASARK
jgi:hypothetical protein